MTLPTMHLAWSGAADREREPRVPRSWGQGNRETVRPPLHHQAVVVSLWKPGVKFSRINIVSSYTIHVIHMAKYYLSQVLH